MNQQKINNDFLKNKPRYLIGCLICFFLGCYPMPQYDEIRKDQLTNIEITLKETPEYTKGDFRNYKFITNEFVIDFEVTNFALDALNKKRVKEEIKKGDKLTFLVMKEDVNNLNKETFWNNFNNVYGIKKNEVEYIEIDKINIYKKKDNVYLSIFVVLGIVSLMYFLGDEIIPIKYSIMMSIVGIISFIIFATLNYFDLIIKQ